MTSRSDCAQERAAMLEQMARASATFHSQAVQLQADFDRLHAQLDLAQAQLDLAQAEIAWSPPLAPPPDMQLIDAAPGAIGSGDQLGSAVEQALYSLAAAADDEADDGNSDRAKLLRACATTLGGEVERLRAALRKAVVLLAGACEHAPELRSHEAYEAVSAAIARATGCVSNFAITRPVPGAA